MGIFGDIVDVIIGGAIGGAAGAITVFTIEHGDDGLGDDVERVVPFEGAAFCESGTDRHSVDRLAIGMEVDDRGPHLGVLRREEVGGVHLVDLRQHRWGEQDAAE